MFRKEGSTLIDNSSLETILGKHKLIDKKERFILNLPT